MTSYCTVDGEKFHYVIQEGYTHLHIVIRRNKMMYDKGSIFIYGFMNNTNGYCGIISYNQDGFILQTIFGSGVVGSYQEVTADFIRCVIWVPQYSVYSLQGTDPFEIARTNG
ncbi:hypothetical protein [Candidatus Stoquefichus massiliensis]|uniref:hypothetical protein n=1 Tax=Candidatus Stoquefichus massiliensis TaxID=1470350 RepID=UPI000480D92F|nr:hypothetical protein [Candidatus Stoquefichus massiliensis]